ncbi:MoxR family ATPase [bacterium]|nr:MoxR family ATPase [bacterium]
MDQKNEMEIFQKIFANIKNEIEKVIVGNKEIIYDVVIAFFSGGHILLEGVPGLGKTLLVNTIAQSLNVKFSRIQFTPDLMPADIIGTVMVMMDDKGKRYFEFKKGPIFGNIILADEINRATPKTQSALLEAMQERQITAGGHTMKLPAPFLVIATQNPIEQEGTYPLPEAQNDRFFFKLIVDYPELADLITIIDRTIKAELHKVQPQLVGDSLAPIMSKLKDIPVARHVIEFASKILLGTHPDSIYATSDSKKYIAMGASPRALQAMIMAGKVQAAVEGRPSVAREDIVRFAKQTLRHRIMLSFEAEAEGLKPDFIIERIVSHVFSKTKQPV